MSGYDIQASRDESRRPVREHGALFQSGVSRTNQFLRNPYDDSGTIEFHRHTAFGYRAMSIKKESLGDRVRRLREQKGWSQKKLASMIPGTSQQSIDQLEQGMVARPRYLLELALALDARQEWLLTGYGKPQASADGDVDYALLIPVMAAVEQALEALNLQLDRVHKGRLICTLYDYMLSEEGRSPEQLEAAARNIVRYEELLQRRK